MKEWSLAFRKDTPRFVTLYFRLTKLSTDGQVYSRLTGLGVVDLEFSKGVWIVRNYGSYF